MRIEPLQPETLKECLGALQEVSPCFEKGGFKWVYKATVNGKKEALKVLAMREVADPSCSKDMADAYLREQYARVRREISALATCECPCIVKLGSVPPVEFGHNGTHFLAYSEEFIEGSDLWKLINPSRDPPSLSELVTLFACLLRCVQELWHHGYVHRDIKPQNVMKTNSSQRPFVLLDLGIAYAVHEAGLTYRPDERMPIATYRYIAPEMLQPDFREHIDYRTDLYTTGMTVYEYAAGRHPLARNAEDMMQSVSRALRQPPTPLRQYRGDLPADFCNLVDGMLKKQPAFRPGNTRMLIKKLEAM